MSKFLGIINPEVVVKVGDNCYFDYGSIIGAAGLGYRRNKSFDPTLVAKPQKFGVIIGDDVLVGANSVVVRGSWRDTVIGDGTKIGNNVTVGHNVIVGKHCIIGPGVRLCGSCEIPDECEIWANTVVSQHVKIPKGVQISGMRLILRSDYPDENT